MVEAVGLTKQFPGKRSIIGSKQSDPLLAVDRIDLSLGDGEIFGLVGPNGAGKTTLIKLLTTLLAPSSGSARVAGHDVVAEGHKVRQLVGLVTSNERSFYWRLTGRQNLAFFANLYEIPRREARQWIDELFELLELEDMANERFDGYSTGMKQRLAFARGLLCKPRFLFMDEPTKGVDPVSRAHLMEIMEERIIARWHPTVLITSHDLSEIERLCGRIGLVNHGRMAAVGSLDQLRELIRSVDRYELLVRGLDDEQLRGLARNVRALDSVRLERHDGATQVSVEFDRDSERFAQFVRGIVEDGGDLLSCASVQESFDVIFQKLLERDRGGEDTWKLAEQTREEQATE